MEPASMSSVSTAMLSPPLGTITKFSVAANRGLIATSAKSDMFGLRVWADRPAVQLVPPCYSLKSANGAWIDLRQ